MTYPELDRRDGDGWGAVADGKWHHVTGTVGDLADWCGTRRVAYVVEKGGPTLIVCITRGPAPTVEPPIPPIGRPYSLF